MERVGGEIFALDHGKLTNGTVVQRLSTNMLGSVFQSFAEITGEKARAVKARYQGVCRGCGAYTQPRNGKGDAYAYCMACHPGAIQRKWTRDLVLAAMHEWRDRYGNVPSSYDWSRSHARHRGGEALERLGEGEWPSASVVSTVFGSWTAARTAAWAESSAATEHGAGRAVAGTRPCAEGASGVLELDAISRNERPASTGRSRGR